MVVLLNWTGACASNFKIDRAPCFNTHVTRADSSWLRVFGLRVQSCDAAVCIVLHARSGQDTLASYSNELVSELLDCAGALPGTSEHAAEAVGAGAAAVRACVLRQGRCIPAAPHAHGALPAPAGRPAARRRPQLGLHRCRWRAVVVTRDACWPPVCLQSTGCRSRLVCFPGM